MTKSLIKRHLQFWNREPDSILLGKLPFSGWHRKPFPLKNQEVYDPALVLWEDIVPSLFVGKDQPLPPLSYGDSINSSGCIYPQAWLEAIAGCSVYASCFSFSSKPLGKGIAEFLEEDVKELLNSPWVSVFKATIAAAIKKSGGNLPVNQLHLRGICDIMVAVLGEDNFCYSAYDQPQKVIALANYYGDLYQNMACLSLKLRDPWEGGYVSSWGLWAPGRLIDYQIDASSLFSQAMYEELILPADEKIISSFPYQVLHLHACGLHHALAISKVKGLRCVEITLERETGVYNFEKICMAAELFQKKGICVLIHGELTTEELIMYCNRLEHRGLAIFYWNPIQSE